MDIGSTDDHPHHHTHHPHHPQHGHHHHPHHPHHPQPGTHADGTGTHPSGLGAASFTGAPHWSDDNSLGPVGPLLDQEQNLINDFSQHPIMPSHLAAPTVPLGVSGDTAALMTNIQSQLNQASAIAGGGMDGHLPGVSSSVQQTMDGIQNTLHMTPSQLAHQDAWLAGQVATGQVSNEVGAWESGLSADHQIDAIEAGVTEATHGEA